MLRTPILLGQAPRRRRPLRTLLVMGLLAAAAAGWLRGRPLPASLQPLLARLHPLAPMPAGPPPAATAAAAAPLPATPPPPTPPADPLTQAALARPDGK